MKLLDKRWYKAILQESLRVSRFVVPYLRVLFNCSCKSFTNKIRFFLHFNCILHINAIHKQTFFDAFRLPIESIRKKWYYLATLIWKVDFIETCWMDWFMPLFCNICHNGHPFHRQGLPCFASVMGTAANIMDTLWFNR